MILSTERRKEEAKSEEQNHAQDKPCICMIWRVA